MGTFTVIKTIVKPTDTFEKFEKKVRKADLDAKAVDQFLDELDKKEGAWGWERCDEIRRYLEEFVTEDGSEFGGI